LQRVCAGTDRAIGPILWADCFGVLVEQHSDSAAGEKLQVRILGEQHRDNTAGKSLRSGICPTNRVGLLGSFAEGANPARDSFCNEAGRTANGRCGAHAASETAGSILRDPATAGH